jgi:hypothetical protein
MPTEHLIPADLRSLYHVREWRNAAGVLATACPAEFDDIIAVLQSFRLLRSEMLTDGGNESPIARRINRAFELRGWKKTKFHTKIVVDDVEYLAPTHVVDCCKGRVALETQWNNKDPFFDRDLNNFRLLFEMRAIDVGVIVTRASELRSVFQLLEKSYNKSTTHHEKLWPRLEGGGGGGCPVLTFAITPQLYVDDGEAALHIARRRSAEIKAQQRRRRGVNPAAGSADEEAK